jgi:hypothetical protein
MLRLLHSVAVRTRITLYRVFAETCLCSRKNSWKKMGQKSSVFSDRLPVTEAKNLTSKISYIHGNEYED